MKTLCFILTIALTIQPLLAGACAMDEVQGVEQDENQVQQVHQHSMNMDHAGKMDHADGAMPDCCESDTADRPADCDDMMDCGSCYAGAFVLSASTRSPVKWLIQYQATLGTGDIVPSHTYPPFRPPIS